jgi:hypothetical protein
MEHTLKRTGIIIAISSLLAILVISILILASVPPVSRDALTHHLALPKLYLDHGGIYEIPAIQFSYYPMNVDLLYMIPLYFGNDIIPKYMHFGFALLTAYLIWGHLRKRLDTRYALLGALLFLTLPVIIKLSITVYVDLGLIFFSFAALIFLLKWINNAFAFKYLLISAVWCGLCLGTKYNGMVVFFLLSLFVVFMYARASAADGKNPLKAIVSGAVFVGIALAIFSPWAIKNYVWTDNPIYPLYNHWFNIPKTEAADISEAEAPDLAVAQSNAGNHTSGKDWGPFATRKIIFKEKWWEISLIPIRIFFQGQDDSPKYFDGKLNPLLFFLPIFAFLNIRSDSTKLKSEKRIWLIFSILFILITLFQTDMRIRYISPVIPPLVVLSIYGFKQLTLAIKNRFSASSAKIFVAILSAIVFLLFGQNVTYIIDQFQKVEPIDFISGRVGRDEYIEKYRPEYAALNFANRHLPARSKILGLFLGNRRYYSDRELIFGVDAFRESVIGSDSADILLKTLKQNGYTHIIIQFDLFNWWVNQQFDREKKEMLETFFTTHLESILSQNGYGLFELRSY